MIGGGVGGLRVLYVDDDETNLKVVSAILEAVGASITCCRRPADGLLALALQPFDIVLLDIHMPEMSGLELLCEMRRRSGANRGIPALALTADLPRDELQYRRLGFDGFIAKPVLAKQLLGGMLHALTANAGLPPTVGGDGSHPGARRPPPPVG